MRKQHVAALCNTIFLIISLWHTQIFISVDTLKYYMFLFPVQVVQHQQQFDVPSVPKPILRDR